MRVLPIFLLILGAAGAHGLTRITDPPPIREVVEWKALGDLGEPPYEHEVLLNLTASWCAPCREMKLTTFRDPEFASLLRDLAIVPVRIEDQGASPSPEFEDAMSRYGVRSVPALVWLSVDGSPRRIIRGTKSTAEVR